MVRDLEFDICEMAMTTYLCAKSYGKAITAIPVFVSRNFHHRAVFHNVSSHVRVPRDLEGRIVGVNRGYTVTTGLWARGILWSEYGVDLSKITWAPTDDEHVTEYRAPPNVDYSFKGKAVHDLLLSGVVDAAVGDIAVHSPHIKSLIPDSKCGVRILSENRHLPDQSLCGNQRHTVGCAPVVGGRTFQNAYRR
jgi:4,5-dihydroxyphthalate decarboxylase